MSEKPHSRKQNVKSGKVGVGKGSKAGVQGPVGNGPRPGASRPSSTGRPSGTQGGNTFERSSGSEQRDLGTLGKAGLAVGGIALLSKLPKKARSLVLIVLLVVVGFSVLKGFGGSGEEGQLLEADPGLTEVDNSQKISNSGWSGNNSVINTFSPTAQESKQESYSSVPAVTPVVSQNSDQRSYFYTPGRNDSVTIMVYMCGTDLESKYGMGTSDLQEMAKATLSSNVHLVVETGGCSRWRNSIVSNQTNQIYEVVSGGLKKLEGDLGSKAMTSPDNLASFIQYCSNKYPADRNILILWDHGGGSVTGYGYDELYSQKGSMTLSSLNSALKTAGIKFDFIGFDACLMATLENGLFCSNYADYLVASEETEPGMGWLYTNWLTALSQNTSISTVELGSKIADDFYTSSLQQNRSDQVSLSVIDLAELAARIPASLANFSNSTISLIDSSDYKTVSDARSASREFSASSKINQIDMIDFADRIGTQEAAQLAADLRSCVKYNRTNISRANGISVYFPYTSTSYVNKAVRTLDDLQNENVSCFSRCITRFANLLSSGQISSMSSGASLGGMFNMEDIFGSLLGGQSGFSQGGFSQGSSQGGYTQGGLSQGSSQGGYSQSASGISGYGSPLGSLFGGYTNSNGQSAAGSSVSASDIFSMLSMFSGRSIPAQYEEEFSWLDVEQMQKDAEYIAANSLDPGKITVTERADGSRVLSLSEEEWGLIQSVELNLFYDDGEGFIDLGCDNVFEFDGDDLLLDWDGTWLTVDGAVCAYYMTSDSETEDGSWVTTGYIPAMLTTVDPDGEEFTVQVRLKVVFSEEYPEGMIVGADPVYVEGETDLEAKGSIPLREGDELVFLCDYYTEDGQYAASYELDSIVVGAQAPELANMELEDASCSVTYRLTDLYGNEFWTPAVLVD